jgi:hypothetical protein
MFGDMGVRGAAESSEAGELPEEGVEGMVMGIVMAIRVYGGRIRVGGR